MGLAQSLAAVLCNRGVLDTTTLLAFGLMLLSIVIQGLRTRPGRLEAGIWTGAVGVYLMVFLRMGIPEERSHLFEYTVGVTATDGRGLSDSGSAGFDVTLDTPDGSAHVASVTYASSGGRGGTKHVFVTVSIVDGSGIGVGGASVDLNVTHDGNAYGSATAVTDTSGLATVQLKNAPAGYFTTDVTDVTAVGLTVDQVTPANQFCK